MAAKRAQLIDRALLGHVGFTDHALERFAERAGIDGTERRAIEPVARDLLIQEGRQSRQPPSWYRSSNAADGYLQAGEWLLFICRVSRHRIGSYDVVTVVTNGERTTWARARDRGLIFTPPPLPATRAPRRQRAGWLASITGGLRQRRSSKAPIGRLAAITQAHHARRQALAAAWAAERADYDAVRQRHREERERAHERHVRMWGRGR
ncbi:MAG TPA: hypothetical protein VGM91_21695 [Conexibacter sp.]